MQRLRRKGANVSPLDNPAQLFQRSIAEHLSVVKEMASQQGTFERVAHEMSRAILGGNKILWCGNGGSAADSQHLAAELMGRFRQERRGLPSIALTTDTSILTAIGNDYGFERVFQRQVEALCLKGDVIVGISTSGNSRNVCAALETARQIGAFTVALTGATGGNLAQIADAVLRVPSKDTARIQEGHILCGHILCDWVETCVCEREFAAAENEGD
jgi:D-sedoheptulose 7-phosphate isomerase